MPTTPKPWAIITVALLLTHAAAFYGGYQYKAREFTPVVEGPRAGADLPGGGKLLPRVPNAKGDIAQPAAPTKGAKHIRGAEVEIGGLKPERVHPGNTLPGRVQETPKSEHEPKCLSAEDLTCPNVKVRLDLWEHADSTWGVTAVTDRGEVVGGLDLPDRNPVRWTPRVWAAGVEYEAPTGDLGVVLERDLGPFRVGGSVEVKSEHPEARARVMWRF